MPAYVIFPDRTLIEMAEKRPRTLDQMAQVGGVGAKKLESYGRDFLAVIAGDVPDMHPQRRKLAGRPEGALFDRLVAVQADLLRGPDGTEKPLSCSTAQIRRIAEARPADRAGLARHLDEARLDRFGEAFLREIADA